MRSPVVRSPLWTGLREGRFIFVWLSRRAGLLRQQE